MWPLAYLTAQSTGALIRHFEAVYKHMEPWNKTTLSKHTQIRAKNYVWIDLLDVRINSVID